MALRNMRANTHDCRHHVLEEFHITVQNVSPLGGPSLAQRTIFLKSSLKHPGDQIRHGIEDQIRLAGLQRLSPTPSCEDSNSFQAKGFPRGDVDRPVSDHDRRVRLYLHELKGTLEMLRVGLDASHRLTGKKYVAQGVDSRTDRANGGPAIAGDNRDL